VTLAEHLAKEQGPTPEYAASVVKVISAIAAMSLDIARELAFASLRGETGLTGGKNFSGDDQKPLDIWAHEAMARALRRSHTCSAYISEEAPEPIEMLCRRLLRRSASESGRLCPGDGTQARGRDPSQGRPPPEGVHVAYPLFRSIYVFRSIYAGSRSCNSSPGEVLKGQARRGEPHDCR
jgi:Fructose-1-6-bisphosphatase, N-terminal domain